MKKPNSRIRNLLYNGSPVYCSATVSVLNKKTNTTDNKTLSPENFRITGNNYTQSCSNDLPIGNVLCQSITLRIANDRRQWQDYDWSTAVIVLNSTIIDNGEPLNIRIGKFYVDGVKYVQSAIEITAYDMICKTNYGFIIQNVTPGTTTPTYSKIWNYFVYLCDTVLATRIGITLGANEHLYTNRCENIITQSPANSVDLSAIQPTSKAEYTLREVFGFVAQLVGANIVVDRLTDRIDIVKLNPLSERNIISGGNLNDEVEDIIDAGTLGDNIQDEIRGYSLSDLDYYVLDKYQSPPELEYADVKYTGLSMEYPVKNAANAKLDSITTNDNVIELYNPLLESAANSQLDQTNIQNILNALRTQICNKPIRPFDGTFLNNVLLEFGDNVLIQDADGNIYQSYITEHTYNYLGGSDISNSTKTLSKSNNTFFR